MSPSALMDLKVEGMTTLLQVFDMPASVAFYRDVLGFEVAQTSAPRTGDDFDWGLLRLNDLELMLNTAYEAHERPPAPDPARVGGHGDTALFLGCRDLDAAYAYLSGKGLDVTKPVVQDYGMKQIYLTDPDGYGICLQWRAG